MAILVEKIVNIETSQCWKMLKGDQHNSEIGAIVRHAEKLRSVELERLFDNEIDFSLEQRDAIERMSKSLIKRLLHNPIGSAHQLAREDQVEKLSMLLDSFIGDKDE